MKNISLIKKLGAIVVVSALVAGVSAVVANQLTSSTTGAVTRHVAASYLAPIAIGEAQIAQLGNGNMWLTSAEEGVVDVALTSTPGLFEVGSGDASEAPGDETAPLIMNSEVGSVIQTMAEDLGLRSDDRTAEVDEDDTPASDGEGVTSTTAMEREPAEVGSSEGEEVVLPSVPPVIDPCLLADEGECPDGVQSTVLGYTGSLGDLGRLDIGRRFDFGDALSGPNVDRSGTLDGHPGIELSSLLDNVLIVYTAREPYEQVKVTFVNPEGTCGNLREELGQNTLQISKIGESTAYLDPLEVALRGYNPGSNQLDTRTYFVTGGSTLKVCADWYPISGREWERNQPNFSSSALVASPARLLPVVKFHSFTPADWPEVRSKLTLTISSTQGVKCGEYSLYPPYATASEGSLICDSNRLSLNNLTANRENLAVGAFDGDLVLRIQVDDQEPGRPMVIRGRDGDCRGYCEVPEPALFGIKNCRRGEICSRPNPGTATSLILEQSYYATSETAPSWIFGGPESVTPEMSLPELPQLDTLMSWETSRGTVPRSGTPEVTGWANYTLMTDRPVSYRLHVESTGVRTGGPGDSTRSSRLPLECEMPGGDSADLVGESTGRTILELNGLCRGYSYAANIELTDADGHVANYTTNLFGGGIPGHRYWPSGAFEVPPLQDAMFRYEVKVTPVSSLWGRHMGSGLIVGKSTFGVGDGQAEFDACQPLGATLQTYGVAPVTLPSPTVPVVFWFSTFGNSTYNDPAVERNCRVAAGANSPGSQGITAMVNWDDLFATGGVQIHGTVEGVVFNGMRNSRQPVAEVWITLKPAASPGGGTPVLYEAG